MTLISIYPRYVAIAKEKQNAKNEKPAARTRRRHSRNHRESGAKGRLGTETANHGAGKNASPPLSSRRIPPPVPFRATFMFSLPPQFLIIWLTVNGPSPYSAANQILQTRPTSASSSSTVIPSLTETFFKFFVFIPLLSRFLYFRGLFSDTHGTILFMKFTGLF